MRSFRLKKVIITGSSGFIGANLARKLIKDGCKTHLLLRKGYVKWRIADIKDDAVVHEIDMNDRERLAKVIKGIKPDWVFHLAAHGGYSWQKDIDEIIRTNFMATVNLVESCLPTGFDAFVNTGSSSEYGFKDHPPKESEFLEPNSYYAVAKAAATQYCRYVAQSRNVNIKTLRLYSAYGPFEEPSRLIPTLIVNGFNNKLPPLVNPGIARDYVYVDDVVDAYLLAAEKKEKDSSGLYNVGTGVQTKLSEVVDTACGLLKVSAKPQWGTMPDRIWDTSVWVSDNEKITRELGWEPKYDFRQGFKKTIGWFNENTVFVKKNYGLTAKNM